MIGNTNKTLPLPFTSSPGINPRWIKFNDGTIIMGGNGSVNVPAGSGSQASSTSFTLNFPINVKNYQIVTAVKGGNTVVINPNEFYSNRVVMIALNWTSYSGSREYYWILFGSV